jgi:hypothetical protein
VLLLRLTGEQGQSHRSNTKKEQLQGTVIVEEQEHNKTKNQELENKDFDNSSLNLDCTINSIINIINT